MMAINLAFGLGLIMVCVMIHTAGLIGLTRLLDHGARRFVRLSSVRAGLSMVVLVLGLFLLHLAQVLVWATGFHLTGAFGSWERTVYLSMNTFSTLGVGDVVGPEPWRLLVSMEGIAGFLLIGWSTAYLVTASLRYGPFQKDVHF